MNDKKKEKPLWLWAIVIVALFIGVNIISFFGYVMEVSSDSSASNIEMIINAFTAITSQKVSFSPLQTVLHFFKGDGTTRKFTILGFVAALVAGLYFYNGNGKRFHKKGIEHGSAHWGTDEEKKIIADTTPDGFYNNVIVASDVFLVLDRKQREINERKAKERKPKEQKNADK